MENKEKIVAKAENCTVQVVERVSKKGNPYKVVEVVHNGKIARVGFMDNNAELSMIHAGFKFNY